MRKISQKQWALLLLIVIAAVGWAFFTYKSSFLIYWLIGIAIGFTFYRSGLCFASACSDIVFFRDFRMFRAALTLLLISFVGFYFVQLQAHLHDKPIPGYIFPVGMHTAVGGLLFGVGMILAGGCVCGTLQRLGEGFLLFWLVLFSIIGGSILGAYHFSWWRNHFISLKPVFLPDIFGWFLGGAIGLAVLLTVYGLTYVVEKRKFTAKRGGTCGGKETQSARRCVSNTTVKNPKGFCQTKQRGRSYSGD